MLVVGKFRVKLRYTYTHFFHVFKSCIGFKLSKCVNEKNVYVLSYVFQKLCWFRATKLFKSQKNKFGMQNTQYNIELGVHKQPSVFNTMYTVQSRVNCPNMIMIKSNTLDNAAVDQSSA